MSFSKHLPIILGTGLVLLAGTAAAFLLWLPRPLTPADFLPADRTTALFSNLTSESSAALHAFFPQLKDVPLSSDPSSVAFVLRPNGESAWLLFENNTTDTSKIFASHPDILDFVVQREGSIARLPSFRALKQSTGPWAFLHFPLLRLDRGFFRIIRPQAPVALTIDDALSLSFLHDGPIRGGRSTLPETTAESSLLQGTLLDASLLRSLLGSFDSSMEIALSSLLQTTISSLLGNSVSVRYDLAPLFDSLSLTIGHSGSGEILFFAAGESSEEDLAMRLDHLHDAFLSHLSSGVVEEYVFEEGERLRTIRNDEEALEQERREEDGWHIETTEHRETKEILLTAQQGPVFVLTNREEWWTARTEKENTLPLDENGRISAGTLHLKPLLPLLRERLPSIVGSDALLPFEADTLTWTLTSNAGHITLRLEAQGKL